MATVNNLSALGSASMSSIFQKTPAEIAKATQTKEIKTKAINATVSNTKPASLGVGEVVKVVTPAVTDASGKVTTKATTAYYTGTANGGLSKPLKSISSVVDTANSQIKKAEAIQTTALRTAQKIELSEIKQTLKEKGVPDKDIASIVKAENAANKLEITTLTGLLAAPSLQYGTRDPATNAFTTSATKSALPTSLLNYNDPVIAPTIQNNIKTANNAVAEFELLKGITQPFLPSGNTVQGINPYAIYKALDSGSIIATKDANGITTGYTVSPEVAKAKGDQSGFMDATGMSKASARALGLVLNNDAIIGGKANVVVDGKGNYFVNDSTGADRYGKQNALVDSGEVDKQGNKIFVEVATDNSKRNKVSVVSNYVQQPDGTFKYAGVNSTDYTHIEGFNPIKALAIAGMTAGAGMAFGPLTGLTGVLGSTGAGAVAGALGSALSGSNILKGALLGGLGGFGVGEIQAAAKVAGGYDNLFSQVGGGDLSAFTGPANAGIKLGLDSAGNIIDATTGQAYTGAGIPNLNVNTILPTTGINAGLLGGTTAGDVLGANMGGVGDVTTAVDLNPITNVPGGSQGINLSVNAQGQIVDNATGLPFSRPGINLALDAANNIIDATTGQPFTGEGINVINPATGTLVNPVEPIPFLPNPEPQPTETNNGNGLLDDVTKFINDHKLETAVAVGGIGGSSLINALTPSMPATPNYTAPLLTSSTPGSNGSNGTTDWNSYYNNLFKRQGVGAGNYLGYDLMNRLGDIPPELMGLLGTSAQPTTGVTSGQTAGVP